MSNEGKPKIQNLPEPEQDTELTPDQAEEAQGGSGHTGGINAVLMDGSVRGVDSPTRLPG